VELLSVGLPGLTRRFALHESVQPAAGRERRGGRGDGSWGAARRMESLADAWGESKVSERIEIGRACEDRASLLMPIFDVAAVAKFCFGTGQSLQQEQAIVHRVWLRRTGRNTRVRRIMGRLYARQGSLRLEFAAWSIRGSVKCRSRRRASVVNLAAIRQLRREILLPCSARRGSGLHYAGRPSRRSGTRRKNRPATSDDGLMG
jgi:hypothetical protein